jgi:hypothetical protein
MIKKKKLSIITAKTRNPKKMKTKTKTNLKKKDTQTHNKT